MFHLRMMIALIVLSLSSVAVTSKVYAASSPTTAGDVKPAVETLKLAKDAENLTKLNLERNTPVAVQTDIDAEESLPMLANIVVWREADVSAPKNILKFSALKDSLIPTDRDRLAGEVRYASVLNQSFDQK